MEGFQHEQESAETRTTIYVVKSFSPCCDYGRGLAYCRTHAAYLSKKMAWLVAVRCNFIDWEVLWKKYAEDDRSVWEEEKNARYSLRNHPELQEKVVSSFIPDNRLESWDDFKARCAQRSAAGFDIDFATLSIAELMAFNEYMVYGLDVRNAEDSDDEFRQWENEEIWSVDEVNLLP